MLGLGLNLYNNIGKKQIIINNLLLGDFETDLSNFTIGASTGTVEISTLQKYTGNSSLRCALSANAGSLYIDVLANAGDKMYCCALANKQSGTATQSILRMFDYGGTTTGGFEVIRASNINASVGDWLFFSNIKPVTTNGVRIYIGSSVAQTVEYYIDSLLFINLTNDFGVNTPLKSKFDLFIQSKLLNEYFISTIYN